MRRVSRWLIAAVLGFGLLGTSLLLARPGGDEKPTKAGPKERQVTIDQVPKSVQKTILKQAGKNKIREIEEVTKDGRTIYEAEWVAGGKEIDIQVGADGKLLGREVEEAQGKEKEEADEDEEDEDKDEGDEEREGKERPAKKAKKAEESERRVMEAEVPNAALAALKKLAAGAKITEFAEEIEHGHTFYEGSFKAADGGKTDVLVTPTGDLVEIEEQVASEDVPAAVLAAAQKVAGKKAKLAFEKKTMLLYEVKFSKGDRHHELLLTPDGRRAQEEVEKGKKGDDDDEDEEDEDQEKDRD